MTVVTKDREANELLSRADALIAEIRDVSKPLTTEQLDAKRAEVEALRKRATMLAEFTPEGELKRQGAEGLTPVDAQQERKDFEQAQTAHEKMRKFAVSKFRNLGEFMRAASHPQFATPAQQDAIRQMTEMTRAITGDGSAEVLLPLTQEASIFSVSNVQEGILQYARRYPIPGRSLRIPMLEQTEGTNTLNRPMAGKIANVTYVDEGALKPERDPVFTQRLIEAKKAAAITELGDEILADDFTGQLPGQIVESVGQQVLNFFNEQFTIDGTTAVSAGGPTGALASQNGALLVVDRQTQNTITSDDVFNMYAQHTHGPNSRWFVNRNAVPQLMKLTLNGNSLVTWLMNLRDKPQMMLLGLPVTVTDLLNPLGTQSDFALINPDFYAVAWRQGLTVQSSIHEKFRYDLTVYRFVARAGGVPLPTSTYAYKYANGAKINEHSPFVTLGLPSSS